MLLADIDIARCVRSGDIKIEPYYMDCLNPASIDLTLSPKLRVPHSKVRKLDLEFVQAGHTVEAEIDSEDGYTLFPGGFLLASTNERVTLGKDMAGRLEGKSSLARLGLTVHVTGGYIDPGFDGEITLEMVNHAPWAIVLRRDARIAQLSFESTVSIPRFAYSDVGHYQGQLGPTESRYRMGVPVSA